MQPPVPLSEHRRRIAALNKYDTVVDAAAAVGTNESTMRHFARHHKSEIAPKAPKPVKPVKTPVAAADKPSPKKDLQERDAKISVLEAEIKARDAADAGVSSPWDIKRVKISAGDDRLIPVLALSDWHVGEEVIKSDVPNGCNEYNIDIAKARATKLINRAVWLIKNSGQLISQDTIVIGLL